nr:probable serine/threonine-protein kinase MARK-A [Dermatophagoides farinae]
MVTLITIIITICHFVHCTNHNIVHHGHHDYSAIINDNIIEEEPIPLNSIEKANAAFKCQSDGYFADVAYGCQFYHVCENANNPYDKPSFVKHTFSCVNGTVFNQMSFTCTRYDDSIPCDASPSYFYLNKRNGDPKHHHHNHYNNYQQQQQQQNHKQHRHHYRRPKQQLDRNEHRNRLISSSSLILEHSTTLKNNHRQPHLHRAPSPYELETPKTYLSTGGGGGGSNGGGNGRSSSSTITTPVIIHKYPKYESTPNKLMNTYVPMDYNTNRQINSKSLSSTSTLDKKLFNYGPLRQTTTVSSSYDGNISIDNLKPTTATYTTKLDTDNLSSYEIMKKYSSPKNAVDTSTTDRPLIDYGNISPTPISAHKGSSSTFTPATFSQLYIENQKASKLEPIPASYVRLVEQRQQQMQQQQQRNKPTTLKAFNHINEQLISLTPMNNKTEQYTKIGSNHQHHHHHHHNHGSVLPSPLSSSTLSKYEQLIAQSLAQNNNGHSTQISPNHYVTVASPIRIIEPTREISRSLINSNGKDQTLSSSTTIIDDNVDNNQQQPVKISFVNDNNNMVKQIKGKNLLIDPSLENDPERDSIIAQVLEMLNKYN